MKTILCVLFSFIVVTSSQAQGVKLGMAKCEIDSLIARHPNWTIVSKGALALRPVDSPTVVRQVDHGTFDIKAFELYGMKGTLTYRLNIQDAIDDLSWRSDYLTLNDERNALSRAYVSMVGSFASDHGPAASSQDPETLMDISTWETETGKLRLIYDSRFPHIFVTWSAKRISLKEE